MNEALDCWNCGASLAEIPRPISRQANCLRCHAELHACRQCRHFAPKRPTQCLEERAEPPTRKEIANFCEWFSAAQVQSAGALDRNAAAKSRLDALFAGSSSGGTSPGENAHAASAPELAPDAPALSKADAAKAELERMFGGGKKK